MQQCERTMLAAAVQEMSGSSFLLTSFCCRRPFRLLDTTRLQTETQANAKRELAERSQLVLELEWIMTMRKCQHGLCHQLFGKAAQVTCDYSEEKVQPSDLPFGIEQVTDLLIVDLHKGHLHLKSMALVLLLVDPLKQRAAESRDQTRLLPIPHHGKGLA